MAQGVLVDEDGDASDWIEIQNRSEKIVSLAGWKLSNRKDGSDPWAFPDWELPAGGFLVVLASGKNRVPQKNGLHCDFRLSRSPEYLRLIRPDGSFGGGFAPYPGQEEGFSYGVDAMGTPGYLLSPTPGEPNGEGVEGFVAPVEFSVKHGLFDAPITVELDCATEGAQILYTTDGNSIRRMEMFRRCSQDSFMKNLSR